MFQVFSRVKNHRPELWAATERGQILALLVPVRITLMNGLIAHLTAREVAYGSVLCSPSVAGHQALAVLLQSYVREAKVRSLFTELRNLDCLEDVQPILNDSGFRYEPHLNYLIDLKRTPEAIFNSIGRRTRKNIRHALNRSEVVTEEVNAREQISICYDLLSQTYRAARVPLADRSLFEAAYDVLYPRGLVRFTLARVGPTPIATSVELLYKDVVYGWYAGMDRSYGSYVPNELLMWDILRWAAGCGYRVYDFGGAGKPNEEYGVREFKAKFGGELVSYGRNVCTHAPARLWLSTKGFQVLRRWL
jgi:lipid II:glycine glycyltransferase (peptidoglycan interpeptide bridge formation enzyme)